MTTDRCSSGRLEVDLRDPVETLLRSMLSEPVVVDEIDAGYGVADLIGASAPRLANRRPHESSLEHPMQLALVDYLGCDGRSEHDLKAWAPWGWRQLKRCALDPMLEIQLVSRDAAGAYIGTWLEADPFDTMVAVELKVRDWRRAVAQAFRYRLFADSAYIAMPPRPAGRAVDAAVAAGIGVMAVTDSHAEILVPALVESPPSSDTRRLVRERMLGALWSPAGRRVAGSPIAPIAHPV